ncbi:MAG: hypothetical protein ACREMB_12230, partial [Candidatus Rokuibacteriota bacterium]
MFAWERAISSILHPVRLDSIKGRVLVFALLATLIPSLTLGWQSYVENRRFLTDKISEDVRNATFHAVREFDLWLKERVYEMRVFSSSYEVVENVEKIHASGPGARAVEGRARLIQYLQSVRAKFADYEELLVVGRAGAVLAASGDGVSVADLPPDWLRDAEADAPILGRLYWDEARARV